MPTTSNIAGPDGKPRNASAAANSARPASDAQRRNLISERDGPNFDIAGAFRKLAYHHLIRLHVAHRDRKAKVKSRNRAKQRLRCTLWVHAMLRALVWLYITAKSMHRCAMDDTSKGLLITTVGVLLVVPDSLFVRLIDASAFTIAFWRLLLAGGMLGLGILAIKGTGPFRAALGTGVYGFVYMAGVGVSGIFFILAVSLTSVANVVFIIASLPVFAAVYSRIFLAEPIRLRMWLTMAFVMLGLAVIAYGSAGVEQASLAGDALALAVSALFAAALTAARRVKHVSMVPAVAMGYIMGALIVLPFAAPFSVPATQVPLVGLHGGLILGSSVLLAIGPRYITSAEVGLLILLETALAPLLAWAVVKEDPGPYALVGGAIVIGALFASNLIALRREIRNRH